METNKKQTAVEWLIEELGEYFPHEIGGIHLMVDKAKQIERKQIERAFDSSYWFMDGQEYYEETYGK